MGPSAWLINSMWDAAFGIAPFFIPQVYIDFHDGNPGSGGTAAALPIDRQPAIFEREANGLWRTAGAPLEVFIDIPANDNRTITHISLHTALDGGNWVINMVANQPIPVVLGDIMIASDLVRWAVADLVS